MAGDVSAVVPSLSYRCTTTNTEAAAAATVKKT